MDSSSPSDASYWLIAQGMYADIFLREDDYLKISDAQASLSVIKVVCAPEDGVDENRLPHNIILELKILQRCNHPNVIKPLAYEYEAATLIHRLTLPYIPILVSNIILSPPGRRMERLALVKSIAWQCLHGLRHIHRHGVSHRDINPRNLMIDELGTVKMIDFSTALAPRIHQTYEQGETIEMGVGTGSYRAPELLFGFNKYDPTKIDLWSLGSILVEFFHLSPTNEEIDDPDVPEETNDHRLFRDTFGDIGLAASIFKIRGHPKYSWPGFELLPDCAKVEFDDTPPHPLSTILPSLYKCALGRDLLELFEALLQLSPDDRPPAKNLLDLPVFASDVLIPITYPIKADRLVTQVDGMKLYNILGPRFILEDEKIRQMIYQNPEWAH